MGILLQVLLHQRSVWISPTLREGRSTTLPFNDLTKSLNGLLNTGPGAVAASETLVIDTPRWFPLRKISAARFHNLFAKILPIRRRVASSTAIGARHVVGHPDCQVRTSATLIFGRKSCFVVRRWQWRYAATTHGDSAGGEGGLTRGTNDVSSDLMKKATLNPGPPWPPEDPRAENEYVLDHIFSFGFKNSNALDGIQDQPKWTRGYFGGAPEALSSEGGSGTPTPGLDFPHQRWSRPA